MGIYIPGFGMPIDGLSIEIAENVDREAIFAPVQWKSGGWVRFQTVEQTMDAAPTEEQQRMKQK